MAHPVVEPTQVVVGILRNRQGKFLIARRPDHVLGGGQWEFPGGKREAGESVSSALRRELMEEIGIEVLAAEPMLQSENNFYSRKVRLDVWHVTNYRNRPVGAEGQEIRWISQEEFSAVDFLDGNKPLLQAASELATWSRRS